MLSNFEGKKNLKKKTTDAEMGLERKSLHLLRERKRRGEGIYIYSGRPQKKKMENKINNNREETILRVNALKDG